MIEIMIVYNRYKELSIIEVVIKKMVIIIINDRIIEIFIYRKL